MSDCSLHLVGSVMSVVCLGNADVKSAVQEEVPYSESNQSVFCVQVDFKMGISTRQLTFYFCAVEIVYMELVLPP